MFQFSEFPFWTTPISNFTVWSYYKGLNQYTQRGIFEFNSITYFTEDYSKYRSSLVLQINEVNTQVNWHKTDKHHKNCCTFRWYIWMITIRQTNRLPTLRSFFPFRARETSPYVSPSHVLYPVIPKAQRRVSGNIVASTTSSSESSNLKKFTTT